METPANTPTILAPQAVLEIRAAEVWVEATQTMPLETWLHSGTTMLGAMLVHSEAVIGTVVLVIPVTSETAAVMVVLVPLATRKVVVVMVVASEKALGKVIQGLEVGGTHSVKEALAEATPTIRSAHNGDNNIHYCLWAEISHRFPTSSLRRL